MVFFFFVWQGILLEMMKSDTHKHIAKTPEYLLKWYDKNKRMLPWRPHDGSNPEPYKVWLSEIMLQQTQVATVIPYFLRFTSRWPTVMKLANADVNDIMTEWAGLGYYARARNLHRCAKIVAAALNSNFPDNEKELIQLPGIGAYTAAAITAIAFGKKATPMDGNFDRVTSRLNAIEVPLPASKTILKRLATMITPDIRPGDYAQAVMDLGATICTPKQPKCSSCPISFYCLSFAAGKADMIPMKNPKSPKKTRFGVAFLCINNNQEVLLQRRPNNGLLGGMMEIPGTEWRYSCLDPTQSNELHPIKAVWKKIPGKVVHTFTHFNLEIKVERADVKKHNWENDLIWHPIKTINKAGLPSLMLKIVKHGLQQDF